MDSIMNFLQSISIIIASGVAIYGINAWRREFVGKKRIELAEEVLATFYAIKDAFVHIRYPLSWESEGSTRQKQNDETPEETKILNRAYIVFERFDKYREIFSRFAALKYRFMVTFGKEHESIFSDINGLRSKILSAARCLPTYWLKGNKVYENNKKLEEKFESVVYGTDDGQDTINDKLEEMQKRLEEITASCFTDIPWWKRIKQFISVRQK